VATEEQKKKALDVIRANIERSGRHVYIVSGGSNPRFAYTIGLSEKLGAELVLAGAAFFTNKDVGGIVDDVAAELSARGTSPSNQMSFDVSGCGKLSLRQADVSWGKRLLLGALHYYNVEEIQAFQILPDEAHWTIDVPDMSRPCNSQEAPVWRWQKEPWEFPVAADSIAVTDLAALRGEPITEACRWEETEWEIFAGDGTDIPKEDLRTVPLGTLLGFDKSLSPVLELPIGEGLWREPGGEWHPWKKRTQVEENDE